MQLPSPSMDSEMQSVILALNSPVQVAVQGSVLFFSALTLQNLDPVYAFSSDWFMEVFRKCIQAIQAPASARAGGGGATVDDGNVTTEHDAELFESYLAEIIKHLTLSVYRSVTNGILNKHCLPFALKLCAMLIMHGGTPLKSSVPITRAEWTALLRETSFLLPDIDQQQGRRSIGGGPSNRTTRKLKPESLSQEAWEGAVKLDRSIPAFAGLLKHITQNPNLWVQFSKSDCPWEFTEVKGEASVAPVVSKKSVSSKPFAFASINQFQMLLLIRIFCPSQFAASVKWFIEVVMGAEYTVRAPCSLDTVHGQTTRLNPALIIITPSESTHMQTVLML